MHEEGLTPRVTFVATTYGKSLVNGIAGIVRESQSSVSTPDLNKLLYELNILFCFKTHQKGAKILPERFNYSRSVPVVISHLIPISKSSVLVKPFSLGTRKKPEIVTCLARITGVLQLSILKNMLL